MFPRFPFFGQRGAGRRWPLYGLVRPVGGAWKSCGGRTKRSSFSQCNALTQLAHCTRGSKRIRRRLIMDGRRLLLLLLCVLQLSRLVRSTVLEGGEQLLTPFLNSVGSHVELVKCFTLIRFQFFTFYLTGKGFMLFSWLQMIQWCFLWPSWQISCLFFISIYMTTTKSRLDC